LLTGSLLPSPFRFARNHRHTSGKASQTFTLKRLLASLLLVLFSQRRAPPFPSASHVPAALPTAAASRCLPHCWAPLPSSASSEGILPTLCLLAAAPAGPCAQLGTAVCTSPRNRLDAFLHPLSASPNLTRPVPAAGNTSAAMQGGCPLSMLGCRGRDGHGGGCQRWRVSSTATSLRHLASCLLYYFVLLHFIMLLLCSHLFCSFVKPASNLFSLGGLTISE